LTAKRNETLRNARPAAAIKGEATAGNDAVDMGMEHQGLTPGVKNGEHAHARTESGSAEIE
jgi:hypothetical protein